MSGGAEPAALQAAMATEQWQTADERLARILDAVLDKESVYVKNFYLDVDREQRDSGTPVLVSGFAMLGLIRRMALYADGTDRDEAEEEFRDKVYFKLGMSKADVISKAGVLEQDLARVPQLTLGRPYPLLHWLIEKMPSALSEEKKTLKRDLRHGERRREGPMWDDKELARIIASDIHAASVGEREAAVAAAAAAAAGRQTARVPAGPCQKCGFDFCPGARGNACAAAWNRRPSVTENPVCDANRTPLTERQHAELARVWDRKAAERRARPRRANVGEAGYDGGDGSGSEWDDYGGGGGGGADGERDGTCAEVAAAEAEDSADSAPRAPEAEAEAAAAAPPVAAANAAETLRTAANGRRFIELQLDDGANLSMLKNRVLAAAAPAADLPPVKVRGVSEAGPLLKAGRGVTLKLKSGDERMAVPMHDTPGATRDIISEDWFEQAGIEVYTKTGGPLSMCLHWPVSGHVHELYKRNGLLYGEFEVDDEPEREAAHAALPHSRHEAVKWAARMGVGSAGLERVKGAVTGLNVGNVPQDVKDAIDCDRFRAKSTSRRKGSKEATPAPKRDTEPGRTWIVDGWGPTAACDPVDGTTYQFVAVDEATSRVVVRNTKRHTTDDFVDFCALVKADAGAYGRTAKTFRFDRAPELRNDRLRQRLASELDCNLELAARGQHESVGRPESVNDVLTRIGEADVQRAGKKAGWILRARKYAALRVNMRPLSGDTVPREQRYTGRPVDVAERPPYLWGSTVIAHEDEKARGPKGTQTRACEGTLIGMDKGAYEVLKANGSVVYPKHVRPLDEDALVRRGLPAGAAMVDAETQTPSDGVPLTPSRPAPPPRPEPAPPPPVVDGVDVGDALEVYWLEAALGGLRLAALRELCKAEGVDAKGTRAQLLERLRKGRPADKGEWYRGTVVATREQPTGARHHEVLYEGWTETTWHDLARPEAHRWRRAEVPVPAPAPAPSPSPGPAAEPPAGEATRDEAAATRRYTRAQARRVTQLEAALEAAMAQEGGDVCEAFAAAAYQWLGDAALSIACDTLDDVPKACAAAEAAAAAMVLDEATAGGDARECSRAAARRVAVNTDGGEEVVLTIPSDRTLAASPQRDEWIEADRRGLDVILAVPGNRPVPVTVPRAMGVPVAPTVTTRVIKTAKDTGKLDKFASRHSFDDARVKPMDEAMGIERFELTSSSVADDRLINITLADAAARDRNLTKLDIGSAYAKVPRKGSRVRYMAMPVSLPMADEDGTPMCIELGGSWIWGEAPSGRALQDDVIETLEADGWRAAENVECCFRKELPNGNEATLLTIVDDFLVSENEGHALTDGLHRTLEARYKDIKIEKEPSYFAGRALRRDRSRRALTVSMPRQTLNAAAQYLPEGAERMTAKQLDLPEGKKLRDMADRLVMVPADKRSARPPKHHTAVRSITGTLKFVEKVMPAISLITHRLSCVNSYPPPEAEVVARAALHYALLHRDEGITYGGGGLCQHARLTGSISANFKLSDGAAAGLEATADATWSDPLLYAVLMTYHGASVHHTVKKVQLIVDSSTEMEGYGTGKAGEIVTCGQEILRAIGVPVSGPTFIGTDNKANAFVASGSGSSTRLKHCMRRYHAFLQRVRRGEVEVGHVPDVENPSDFLTKWVGKDKFKRSLAFATNAANRVVGGSDVGKRG